MEGTRIAIRSAKAKGARLQRQVADMLLAAIPQVAEQDIKGTSMGRTGPDLELSREAQGFFPFAIECKNTQTFTFWSCMNQALRHVHNERHGILPLLVFKKNRSGIYCSLEKPVLTSLASAIDPAGTDILAAAVAAKQRPGFGTVPAAAKAALDSAPQRKSSGAADTHPALSLLQQLHGFSCVVDSFSVWTHLEKLQPSCKKHGLLPYLELSKKTTKPAQHPYLKANQPFSLLPFSEFLEMYTSAKSRGWRFDPATGGMGTHADAAANTTSAEDGSEAVEVHGAESATGSASASSAGSAVPSSTMLDSFSEGQGMQQQQQQQYEQQQQASPLAVSAMARGPHRAATGVRNSSTLSQLVDYGHAGGVLHTPVLAAGSMGQEERASNAGLECQEPHHVAGGQRLENGPSITCTLRVRGNQVQNLLATVSLRC